MFIDLYSNKYSFINVHKTIDMYGLQESVCQFFFVKFIIFMYKSSLAQLVRASDC